MARTATLVLAALLAGSAAAAEENKTSATRIDNHTWRIAARVEFYGDGLPAGRPGDALIAWWVRGVERQWNRDAFVDVEEKGATRRVDLQFKVIALRRAAGAPPRTDAHAIEVVRTLPNLIGRLLGRETRLIDGYRSWVSYDAKTGTMRGCWANLCWPTVIAHEFGHIWGLDDEYDTTTNGLARYFKSRPKEWPPSLMDWSWMPLARAQPRHFRRIWENIDRYGWRGREAKRGGSAI